MPGYRRALRVCAPIVRRWGRLEVVGRDVLPASGPVLLLGNHDSYWDPVAIGIAGLPRRQIQALAKSTLWKSRAAWLGDGRHGPDPDRARQGRHRRAGRGDRGAGAGACIGVFPEGTISRGERLRARSGAGRLALAVPEARVVCCTATGVVDIIRFPKRPHIRVEFFEPASGQPRPGESADEMIVRMMAEVRERAPIAIPGRKRTAAKYRRAAAERG